MTAPAVEVPPVEQLEVVAAVTAASITWKRTPPGVSTVLRRTPGGTPAADPGDGTAVDVPARASRVTDLGLAPSTTYTWTAWNSAAGVLSDPVSVTAATGPQPPPEAVAAQQAADSMAPYIAAALILILAGDGSTPGGPGLAARVLGILKPFWDAEYGRRGGTDPERDWELFVDQMTGPLSQTKPDSSREQADTVAGMSAQAIVNQITHALAGDSAKTWWTMLDSRVRATHRPMHAVTVPAGQPFLVGPANTPMDYPGQPVGDPALWLRCRCILTLSPPPTTASGGPDMADDDTTAAGTGDDLPALPGYGEDIPGYDEDDLEDVIPFTIPWHGILAVEGEDTGDGRRFAGGAVVWDDAPMPLRWQEQDTGGHNGAIVVGTVDRVWRDGDRILGEGVFSDTEAADRAVGAVLDGDARGVSIDGDDVALADDGGEDAGSFTKIRLRGATLVHIPAFKDAAIQLGWDGDAQWGMVSAVSDRPWDGSASRFTPEQWAESCIVHLDDTLNKSDHKLPIREPDGTLSRAGVHAAAGRVGQVDAPPAEIAAARRRLAAAYRELGEEPPESLTASAEVFGRGRGWVTNPKETRRLHHYWTKGEGAAKIRWGTPGDFRRLRRHLAKYINPLYLNRTVAQWHRDATGFWPGQCGKPGNPPCGKHRTAGRSQVRSDQRRAEGGVQNLSGPQGGMGVGERADTGRSDHRPSVQGETVLQSGASGTCDVCGEHPSAVGAQVAGDSLAAAVLREFPHEWFTDPGLDGPTPLTVTDDGRVYGHLATWGVCHVGISGQCVTAPRSANGYASFRTGAVRTDQGLVSVGHLTIGTGHASIDLSATSTVAHYDHTGTVAADVAAGEDDYGIWVAGAVRDGITDQQLHGLQAGAISGDWRGIDGNLELVAALIVNVPGFPVPRPALAASGATGISVVVRAADRVAELRSVFAAERLASLSEALHG